MATAVLDNYTNNEHHTHVALKKPIFLDSLQQHGVINPKQLIGDALHQRVQAIDHELCDPGEEDTFFVADLGEVYRQHIRWKKNLPRVRPFYGKLYSAPQQYPNSSTRTNPYSSRQMQP